jgi:hypothetical protein
MGDKKKTLLELKEHQEKLRAQAEENKQSIENLKKELAVEEMAKLITLTKKFSKYFAPSGVVHKAYEELRDQLNLVRDYDPQYLKNCDINDPVADYFVHFVFESQTFQGGLRKALNRIINGKNVVGNPFSEIEQ